MPEKPSIGWNCVRLAIAVAAAVTTGFTWTVGQNGLHQTNANICELWKSLPLPAYPGCEFQNVLPIVWGAVFCAFSLWAIVELCKIIGAFSKRENKLLAYSLLSIVFLIGAMVSIGFLISEYRAPALTTESGRTVEPVKKAQIDKLDSNERAPELKQGVTKPAFDLGGNTDVVAKKIQLCGEMTIVRSHPGSGGSIQINDFTGIAPETKCSFPPPTEVMKGLSNQELKQRVATLCGALATFQKSIDDQMSIRLNDQQRRALDQRRVEEFKSRYLEQAMELNNAIAARIGWIDIPQTKPNEKNEVKAQMWSTLTRHGRSTLIFGKPIGLDPAMSVSNYLTFIAEKLPE